MIYTIGRSHYEDYLDGPNPLFKKGRDEDYPGGWAYTSYDKAKEEADKHGYNVYKLVTDESNIYEKDGHLHIIEDCEILRI